MDGRSTLTDCDEAGDYVVPNVLSPSWDLVARPDNITKVYHTHIYMIKTLQKSVSPEPLDRFEGNMVCSILDFCSS